MSSPQEWQDAHIRDLARRFRAAIIGSNIKPEDFPSLGYFPQGACGDASLLLGEYLYEQGEGEWRYVAGSRLPDGHTHAWIEKGGLLVDITADQFPDIDQPVIVTRDRSWHRQFRKDNTQDHGARLDIYDYHTKQMLRAAYDLVKRAL